MNYREYGAEHREVILLLHGGGLSWWHFREAAERLAQDYHIVLPILDGHAGSDRHFTTIQDNADAIIRFIDERFAGQVMLIGGASLGGQILLEMLAKRPRICRYALVESALAKPSRLLHAMIGPAFGSCYGLIRRRWFSRLQFRSLHMKPSLFDDYYRDSCAISKADMMAFLKENAIYTLDDRLADAAVQAQVLVGERENAAMHVSVRRIHTALPGSNLTVLPGLYHGEFSINHADDYVKMLCRLIGQPE